MSNDNDLPPSCFLKGACDEKQQISLQWPNQTGEVAVCNSSTGDKRKTYCG